MALQPLASTTAALHWLRERGVSALASDSRRVRAGDAFIAWPGQVQDARRFVRDALAQGARACLVEAQGASAFDWAGLDGVASLPDLKRHAGSIASAFMGEPSRQLTMLATTGTNGKTSTAWWTAQALASLGRRCGVIGTLGSGVPPLADGSAANLSAPGLTTPDPISLHATLRSFVDAGLQACAIEASSIGVAEHRLGGVHLDAVMFTNLTQDHLDYHGTMEAYLDAKLMLFDGRNGATGKATVAIVNADDAAAARVTEAALLGGARVVRFGEVAGAEIRIASVRPTERGLELVFVEGGAEYRFELPLLGRYNAWNAAAAFAAARAMGVSAQSAMRGLQQSAGVPGRLERVEAQVSV